MKYPSEPNSEEEGSVQRTVGGTDLSAVRVGLTIAVEVVETRLVFGEHHARAEVRQATGATGAEAPADAVTPLALAAWVDGLVERVAVAAGAHGGGVAGLLGLHLFGCLLLAVVGHGFRFGGKESELDRVSEELKREQAPGLDGDVGKADLRENWMESRRRGSSLNGLKRAPGFLSLYPSTME